MIQTLTITAFIIGYVFSKTAQHRFLLLLGYFSFSGMSFFASDQVAGYFFSGVAVFLMLGEVLIDVLIEKLKKETK